MKQIAITGGKGGTGKSTVATALAVALAKNHRVLLVDCDVDCPNDHLLLTIKRERIAEVKQRVPAFDKEKCLKCGKCSGVCKTHAIFALKGKQPIFLPSQCNGCGACVISCPGGTITWGMKVIGHVFKGNGHGVDFLSGELKVNEALSEMVVEAVKEEAEKLKGKYDFVLVDTSAGTHCNVISALKGVDLALAVTEPTPLGEHDLELILRLLKRLAIGFEIVLNRFEEGKSLLIEKAAERHGKRVAAKIPYKREIMVAYSKGIPVKDKSIESLKGLVE